MSKVIIAVLGTAAAGLCAEQALAQSSDRPSTLPPVTVSAEKAKKPVKKKATSSTEANRAAEPAPQDFAEPEPQTLAKPLSAAVISGAALTEARPGERDAAALLTAAPGVAVATGGSVSSLPAINGLGDERIRTELNGMLITSACANRMNPTLSYVDPSSIGKVEVYTALAPVSKGGDSIGGTISVERAPANFATVPGEVLTAATLSTFYRSNGDGFGGSARIEAATQTLNATYNGAWSKSNNYERGGGEEVRSTEYEAGNHALTLTARDGRDLYVLEGTYQKIPEQGFVNQWMDMLDNEGWSVKASVLQHYGWGTLDARAYYQHTDHYMNFLADKNGGKDAGPNEGMPMYTRGEDFGYSVKAEILTSPRDKVRIGNEFHGQTLDDWWPPVAGSMMMGPDTYWNINGGERNRVGTFAEWERKWTPSWSTLLGARNDIVWMDTGNVQPYSWTSMMQSSDIAAATAFNARDHARTDVNFDLTALARYEPNTSSTYEFGYARKTRSPNLYERYAWGTGMMSSMMVNWFGDGNGYVGNLDLKPEVAHTISATAAWRAGSAGEYEVKVTPYYSYVENFIDVDDTGNMMFTQLKFANHDAELYGVNVSGKAPLWSSESYGRFGVNGIIGWVEGERTDGVNLYRIQPLNAKAALTHSLGNWSNTAELQLVAAKDKVQSLRNELETPGYALLNLRTSYLWGNVRFDLAAENVFDKLYYQPLGGVDLVDGGAVAGVGRSFNASVTVKF